MSALWSVIFVEVESNRVMKGFQSGVLFFMWESNIGSSFEIIFGLGISLASFLCKIYMIFIF